MITNFILAVLGILLAIVLWQMFKRSGKAGVVGKAVTPMTAAVAESILNTKLSDARKGDVISIIGGAQDFSDADFTVDRRSAYQHLERRWIDLSGDFRGDRVYLEVEPGRDSATALLDPRKLTLPEVGLTEDRLTEMDSLQDPSATLQWDGKIWNYVSSRELGYFENEAGEGEGLYRWILRESGGPRFLIVEKWEGEPFDVRLGRLVNVDDITVYRASA